jgi:transcriptional regulator with XRE-family HTH domain
MGNPGSRANSPLRSAQDIEESSLERLRDQVRFELINLLKSSTQEDLAHRIGYDSGSQISKILNGFADLPVSRARDLDRLGLRTTLNTSFETLVSAIKEAHGPRRGKRYKPVLAGGYDVFLALPMASTENENKYQTVRTEARNLVSALEAHCGYSVYCGALSVATRTDFDSPGFALEENVPALVNCRRFVLWMSELIAKPSSVWVEAGMALALGKPSTYLVPSPEVLPYILREVADTGKLADLGAVRVHWIDDDITPTSLVVRHRTRLFE